MLFRKGLLEDMKSNQPVNLLHKDVRTATVIWCSVLLNTNKVFQTTIKMIGGKSLKMENRKMCNLYYMFLPSDGLLSMSRNPCGSRGSLPGCWPSCPRRPPSCTGPTGTSQDYLYTQIIRELNKTNEYVLI